MFTTTSSTTLRELDHRCADGIDVHLLWDRRDDLLMVAAFDSRTGAGFTVDVHDRSRAMHVFHHPYAYATEV